MEVKVSCMNQVILNICLSGCLSIWNHNHKKWMDFNIFSFVAISNILHAKHIRIRKVFDSSSCWHSSQDITSTTFYKVILNFWLLYKCVSMCWRILSFSHSFIFCFPLFVLDSVNKKVHFSPQIQTDARQNHFQARSRLQPSGIKFSEGGFHFWWLWYCFCLCFSLCWWKASNYLSKSCIRFPSIKNSFLALSFRDKVYTERHSCYDKVTS